MSQLDASPQAIAQHFIAARKKCTGLSAYPGELPSTLDVAYQVQDHAIKLWDDIIAGWKVGGVPAPLQAQFDAQRLSGPIFKRTVKYSTDATKTVMPVFEEGFAAIEAEFVVELNDVSALPSTPLTLEQIYSAIKRVYIGVEIASSPLQIINEVAPIGPVSDFGNNTGLIVGPEVANWQDGDLSQYTVSTSINAKNVGTTTAPAGLNGPLGAVGFLITQLKTRGYAIPKGTLISTGAITGVHRAYVGDESEIIFEGLGSLCVTLSAKAV